MKVIKYHLCTRVNHGTEEEPNIVQTFNACEIQCSDEAFEANYAIALKEAYNGEVAVEEVPEPETPEADDMDWDAMAEAIKEGVNEV